MIEGKVYLSFARGEKEVLGKVLFDEIMQKQLAEHCGDGFLGGWETKLSLGIDQCVADKKTTPSLASGDR